jgi:D-glycero-D-manno-heptose 1,7-bisphosphate phosphatase
VSNKVLTLEDLQKVTAEMYKLSLNFGGKLGIFAYCIHAVSFEDQGVVYLCKCRKPQPGLINFLMENYQVPDIPIFFVGDKDSDRQAASSANRDITFIPSHFLQDPLKLLDSLLSGKVKESDL